MKTGLLAAIIITYSAITFAQNSFTAVIRDRESGEPLAAATVLIQGTTIGGTTDDSGFVEIKNIPDGTHTILFRYVGFADFEKTYIFPLRQTEPEEVYLSHEEEEIEEVIVTATRSGRTIADLPTRVEAISGEELEEKGNMKPGDIRMLLNESTGIQTQQTSATSYNSSIRIQGLDGKYTQILRDGYPLYSGFSGGLGLLQIVPLDLKQAEVIKGASSTLYGGGAIAGLVNLVSKKPGDERELSFLLNGTSAAGLDISGYYGEKYEKTGATVFASYNSGAPYDPSDIGFTAIPRFSRFTLNPSLFIYISPGTTLEAGLMGTTEERTGGDIRYIEGNGDSTHSYYEKNLTGRFSTRLGLIHKAGEDAEFRVKNSFGYYDRSVEIPGYRFSGEQFSSFTEATYAAEQNNQEWIFGVNLWTEKFSQEKTDTARLVDYGHVTAGAFIQNTWKISELIALETGLRGDYQNIYGFHLLPRISALFKFNSQLTARLGGGLGYKSPTVFTEDAERIHFKSVLPIDEDRAKSERSAGGNLDINFRAAFAHELTLSMNVLFFYTQITDPLLLTPLSGGYYEYQQPGGSIDTRGTEVNIKLTYDHLKLFTGYTIADVHQSLNGITAELPLVARHRVNNVLMYEIHDELKIGFEAYYYSPQKLQDGSMARDFWICGLMAEKIWEDYSVFINFENLLDTRQTRFGSIYSGPVYDPVFADIYAPVDGFVINGGVKIRL
ncbi:MAG: TonB-dependent receptor [Ignavibacteriaceae bacterium]|nr:TonB-dependent receptor [Ignavibacteriaceae bacterium]